jgi:hypothetical protein
MPALERDQARTYELAYREGLRVLAEQQADLDSLRIRAGILMSAAAIATSFLGQAAVREGLSVWGLLGILGFTGVGFACLSMLWPREPEAPTLMASNLIETYAEGEEPVPLYRVHRDLAHHAVTRYGANEVIRRILVSYFQWATALLSAEVLAWVVDLTTGP